MDKYIKIKNVIGREILDSRGNPTVEVDIILENGVTGRASVPSCALPSRHLTLTPPQKQDTALMK